MEKTNYDEASRGLARRAGAPLMRWLLRLDEGRLGFDGFLDSVLTLPGTKQRICDAVARLRDLKRGGVPVAGLVEFQTRPDPDMFGRMLVAGGICWLTVKPTDLPGDRYELCAIVVNLTGVGDCSRHMTIGTSQWTLTPVELNLSTLDAGKVLDEVESGAAPAAVLAWVSVMHRGDDPAILRRWLEIVRKEPDEEKRADFRLAALFANAAGRKAMWENVLEVTQAPDVDIVREWKEKAAAKAKADSVIIFLRGRFGSVPDDLAGRVRACQDVAQLDRWTVGAATAPSLDQFRQDCGL